jgi:hypothetical protein
MAANLDLVGELLAFEADWSTIALLPRLRRD